MSKIKYKVQINFDLDISDNIKDENSSVVEKYLKGWIKDSVITSKEDIPILIEEQYYEGLVNGLEIHIQNAQK